MELTTKDFLQRNIVAISGITAIAFVIIFVLLALLLAARELQIRTLESVDRTVIEGKDLLGPQNRLSKRSQKELDVLLQKSPHILGGFVAKHVYLKNENPVIYTVIKDPIVDKTLKKYAELQESGQGHSSAEMDADATQTLRNSEEVKTGLVKCGRLQETSLPRLEGIEDKVKGVCIAMIPPFVENANLGIVVLVGVDGLEDSLELQEVRRTLLQLQIDLFNREYQGRETWVHH